MQPDRRESERRRTIGTRERRIRERTQLREKILEAAERLFLAEGYESVSMRRIAAEIEYSPTTIYQYFENKLEMMRALTADGHDELTCIISGITEAGELDPLAALKSISREYINYCLEIPNRYELWFRFSELEFERGGIFARIDDQRFPIFHSWLSLLEACIEDEVFADGDAASLLSLIWSGMHGYISLCIRYPDHPILGGTDSIDAMIEMIFKGLISDSPST